MNIFKRLAAIWIDWMLVAEAESRTGISQIEAADRDIFQRDLMKITGSDEERADAREMTLRLIQLGLRSDELGDMVRVYQFAKLYDIDYIDLKMIGQIKNRSQK